MTVGQQNGVVQACISADYTPLCNHHMGADVTGGGKLGAFMYQVVALVIDSSLGGVME